MDQFHILQPVLRHLSEAIIITDSDDDIIFVSPNCTAVLGISENEIFGQGHIDNLLGFLDSEAPEADKSVLPSTFELTLRLRDSPARYLEVKTVCIENNRNRSYIFTDISQQKTEKINRWLQEQITPRLSEGVSIIREDTLEIIYINRQLRDMLYLSPGECLGKPMSFLFTQPGFPQEEELDTIQHCLAENGIWTGNIFNITKERRTKWITLSITRVDHNDYDWVWLAVYSDISAFKQNEGDLRKLNEELEMRVDERTAELQRKNIALAEVMNQLEVERSNLARKIDVNTQKLLLPVLERLIEKSSALDSRYLTMIKQNLQTLTSSFGFKLSSVKYQLTPKEIELCTLIKGGFTIKEIATMQNLSERTVETHRFNIRKKLGISSTKINLASFLSEL